MNTPIEYKQQIENGIFSSELIADVLFSLSKRSKNAADKQKEYSSKNSKYSLENKLKKIEYWRMFKKILTLGGFYPKELYYVDRFAPAELVCRQSCLAYSEYSERLRLGQNLLFCEDPCTSRCPDRHVRSEFVRTDYYLHFVISGHSFVTLSSKKEADTFDHLKWTKLDNIYFDGANIKDLLPVPFCRRVHDCLLATKINMHHLSIC